MSKTIKEWLYELPEPYKTQALTNSDNNSTLESSNKYNSFGEALGAAFSFSYAPEGPHFWINVKNNPPHLSKPITNALQAIHAIAFKKGFPAEEIESIEWLEEGDGNQWRYRIKATGKWFNINLSND